MSTLITPPERPQRHQQRHGVHRRGRRGVPRLLRPHPFENGFISEVLGERGWNTYAVGKRHLTPGEESDTRRRCWDGSPAIRPSPSARTVRRADRRGRRPPPWAQGRAIRRGGRRGAGGPGRALSTRTRSSRARFLRIRSLRERTMASPPRPMAGHPRRAPVGRAKGRRCRIRSRSGRDRTVPGQSDGACWWCASHAGGAPLHDVARTRPHHLAHHPQRRAGRERDGARVAPRGPAGPAGAAQRRPVASSPGSPGIRTGSSPSSRSA